MLHIMLNVMPCFNEHYFPCCRFNTCSGPSHFQKVSIENSNRESSRLLSLNCLSKECPIDRQKIAAKGFYYVGPKDCVKCFSCGKTSENWTMTDDVTASRWHRDSCKMVLGLESDNIPLGNFCCMQCKTIRF